MNIDWLRERRFRLAALFILLLVSFAVRAHLASVSPIDDDEAWYLMDGYNISKGLVPYRDFHGRSPVYVYTLAMVSGLSGNSIFAARMVSVLCSTATIALIYAITRRFTSPAPSLIAAGIFGLSPFTIRYGTTVMTEPMAVMFSLLALWFYLYALDSKRWRTAALSAGCGLFIALGFLTRRSVGIVVPALLVSSLILYRMQGRPVKKWLALNLPMVALILIPFLGLLVFISGARGFEYAHYTLLVELWSQPSLQPFFNWFLSEGGVKALFPLVAVFILPLFLCYKKLPSGLKGLPLALGGLGLISLFGLTLNAEYTNYPGIDSFYYGTGGLEGGGWTAATVLMLIPLAARILTLDLMGGKSKGKEKEGKVKKRKLTEIFSHASLGILVGGAAIWAGVALGLLVMSDQRLRGLVQVFMIMVVILAVIVYLELIKPRYNESSQKSLGQFQVMALIIGILYGTVMLGHYPSAAKIVGLFLLMFLVVVAISWALTHRLEAIITPLGKTRYLPVFFFLAGLAVLLPKTTDMGQGILIPIAVLALVFLPILVHCLTSLPKRKVVVLAAASFLAAAVLSAWVGSHLWSGPSAPGLILASIAIIPCLTALLPFMRPRADPRFLIAIAVAFSLTAFYLTRSWVMPPYWYELGPYGAMSLAMLLPSGIPNDEGKGNKKPEGVTKKLPKIDMKERRTDKRIPYTLLLFVFAVSMLVTTNLYSVHEYYVIQEYNEFHPDIDDVEGVADYIRAHTKDGEEIFAWPVYAYAAQRPMVFNISRPFEYFYDTLAISGYPTTEMLIQHMEATGTRLVVRDIYMDNYILSNNPDLNAYIEHHYVLVMKREDTKVYARAGDLGEFL